tara:strand:+ start:400 stop:597 length:198 start_codon:yes stop_codon:yes gene_type:complete
MKEGVMFSKIKEGKISMLISYTSIGVITVYSDNPFVSVLVEYSNKGKILQINVDTAEDVKEYKNE